MKLKVSTLKLVLLSASALSIVFLQQCRNKTENYIANGGDYFNYTPGNVRDYDFDSSDYQWTSGKLLKFHYLIKEKVMDTFTDLSGHVAVRIEQYISRDTGITYKFYKLQSVFIDNYGCQRVEDNQRKVKLMLPVGLKKWWDGNIYNNLGFEKYIYTGVKVPSSNVYLANQDCLEVTQQDDSTLISRDKQVEVYGKDMGLFYKYDKSIQYNGTGQPQGHIVVWTLRKFKK